MSNPQRENGYTAIANELMEALASIRISGEARQCLDVIFRKTYGYNKKEDNIALSQFVKLTKMPKATICRALLKLAKMNIIIDKNDNEKGKIYRILKDYSLWKPLTKKIIVDKNDNGRYQKRQLSLTKKGTTKEKKENITKEKDIFFENYLFNQTWLDFKELRIKLRKPMTQKAEDLMIKKLHTLCDNTETAIKILEQTICAGWQGVFPLSKQNQIVNEIEAYAIDCVAKLGRDQGKFPFQAKYGDDILFKHKKFFDF